MAVGPVIEVIARVASLGFLGLSFIGWIVFVAGFAKDVERIKDDDKSYDPGDEPNLYAYWVASVVGPVLHILALAHALLFPAILRGVPGAIVGSITSIFFVMYLSAIGFGMVFAGITIRYIQNHKDDYQYDYYNKNYLDELEEVYNLQFAGGFLSTLFLALHLALWPWFKSVSTSSSSGDGGGFMEVGKA